MDASREDAEISAQPPKISDNGGRYDMVLEMVREISLQADPEGMISVFRKRTPMLFGGASSLSLSRRDLLSPRYRITRSSQWTKDVNPWKEQDRLPLLEGGLLAELLYGDEPLAMRDICITPDEPSYTYLKDARSLIALPLYDGGVAINMVVRMAAGESGEMYGRERLLSCVREDVRHAQAIIDCVVYKLLAFTNNEPAADDQTLLALRVN